jgi:ribosomal protein L11 methyltransferase
MAEARWLEISLTVDGELAEPVADLLARYIPDGVVIESTAVTANLDDSEGHAVGPLRVFGYLPVDEKLEATRASLEQGLWYLGAIRPLPEPEYRAIENANWAEAWKQHYRPITIGRRLVIVPAWLESPAPERIPVRIDPGMAFGTGTHPTTQLCLEILDEQTGGDGEAAWDVIDVGCGTAILSIAALLLGARHALGVDIDPEAVSAAAENAATNRLTERVELGLGSLAEVKAGKYSICQGRVVFANILAPVLVRLLDEGLGELLVQDGILILSGILEEQAESVQAAAQRHGLQLIQRRQIGDWVALGYGKNPKV